MTRQDRRARFDAALLEAVPTHARCIERRATAAKNVGTCDCPGGPFHEAIRVAWGDTFQAVTRHD